MIVSRVDVIIRRVVVSTGIGVVAPVAGVVLVRVLGDSLVPDVGVESGPPVGGVGHDLGSSIRKLNPVLASHGVAVAGLASAEVVARGCVLDGVPELVRLGLEKKGKVYWWTPSTGGTNNSYIQCKLSLAHAGYLFFLTC